MVLLILLCSQQDVFNFLCAPHMLVDFLKNLVNMICCFWFDMDISLKRFGIFFAKACLFLGRRIFLGGGGGVDGWVDVGWVGGCVGGGEMEFF